jgi:integrase/recombinase XerC
VTLLLTSGLRASELCGLRWGAVQKREGWYCSFVAKGGDTQEQPLLEEAVTLARAAFKARLRREPKSEDALFSTLPAYKGDRLRPLAYHALWSRIATIGRATKERGIITRDLSFTPHLFRRSFATLLVKGGMDLKAVQALTRHASLEVLGRHYVDSAERPDRYFAELLQSTA